MEEKQFSATDGLQTIQEVIDKTRSKYEENGKWILAWGILITLAGIIQSAMIHTGHGETSHYAWIFTMVPAFIINFIYKSRESTQHKRPTDYDVSFVWLMAGVMAFISSFLFKEKFGIGFTAMLFTPFCVAALAVGLQIKSKIFIWMSVLAAIISFASVYIPWAHHPLIASSIGFVLMVIPGAKLYLDHKKRHRV